MLALMREGTNLVCTTFPTIPFWLLYDLNTKGLQMSVYLLHIRSFVVSAMGSWNDPDFKMAVINV